MNRFRKFFSLGWHDKLLFSEALLLHLYVGLLWKVVPFRWIPGLFKSRRLAVGNQQFTMIEKIRTAVQRAGAVSPWRNRCLVSSLAGRCLLRRRKINSQLYLGVAKDSRGKTIAHAWLKSGDLEIVDRKGDYTELFSF